MRGLQAAAQIMPHSFRHSFTRRCRWHNYRSRCIYMITMLKNKDVPPFSSIENTGTTGKPIPVVHLSSLGKIIYDCLHALLLEYPQLKILRRVAMPDHIHFELFVTTPIPMALGSIMAVFKAKCTTEARKRFPDSDIAKRGISVFTEGFNDKIAFRRGAKDAFYNYIADNPRRYLVKKTHSQWFFHRLMIELEGRQLGLYGNIFLLDNPIKSFVKISRIKERTPDLPEHIKEWEETIRSGGVLVSPFINPEEKLYRDAAIEAGSSIILIVNYRFSDRSKPYRELFNLCGEGRLLIITTEQYQTPQNKITYPEAQAMNTIAATVAALGPREAKLIPRN